jgi:hypothetical protein
MEPFTGITPTTASKYITTFTPFSKTYTEPDKDGISLQHVFLALETRHKMEFPRPVIKLFWNLENFQQPCLLSGTSLLAENKNVIKHKYSGTFTAFNLVQPQVAKGYISRQFCYETTNSSLKPIACACISHWQ